jgi:hypothetical protein
MRTVIYFLMGCLVGAIAWVAFFKIFRLTRSKCLGTGDFSEREFTDHLRRMNYSRASLLIRNSLVPAVVSTLALCCLFLLPLLFRNVIDEWQTLYTIWPVSFCVGLVIARLIKRMSVS